MDRKEEKHTTCSQANKTIARNKTPSCYCDSMCPEYGDCCLESTFGIDASKPRQNCTKFANEAFFVKTDCSASKYKAKCAASANYTIDKRRMRNLVPATSPTTGITYGNRLCALCHNATDVQLWNVNVTCANNFSDTLIVANVANATAGNKFTFSLTQNLTADKLTYSKKTKFWSLKLGNVSRKCSLRPAVPANLRQTVRACHPNLVDHCTINGSVPIVCNRYQDVFQANGTYYKNPACAPCTGVPQKRIKPVAPSVRSAAATPPSRKNSTESRNASRSTSLAISSTGSTRRPYFDAMPSSTRFGTSRFVYGRAPTVTTRMLTASGTGLTNASAGAAMRSTGPATATATATASVGGRTRSASATNVSVGATTGVAKTISGSGSIAATTASGGAMTSGFMGATTASSRVRSGSTNGTSGSTRIRAASEFVGATATSTRTRIISFRMRTPGSTISSWTTRNAPTAHLALVSGRKSINRHYLHANFRDSECSLDQIEMSKIVAETVYYSTFSRTFISSRTTAVGAKDVRSCDITNSNSNSNSNYNYTTRISSSSRVARIVAAVFINLILVSASLFLGLSLRHLVSAECESAGCNREYRCIVSSYTVAALISNAGSFFTNILDESERNLFHPLDEVVNYFTFFASMTCATTMAFHVARTSWKAFYRFSALKNDVASKNVQILYSTLNWFVPGIATTLRNSSKTTTTLHSSIFLIFPFIVFVFVNLSFYASAAVLIRVEQRVQAKLAKLSINFKLFSALLGTTYLMWTTVLLFSHLTSYLLMAFYYFLNLVVSLLIYRIVKGEIGLLGFSTETVSFMGDDSTLAVRNKAE